MRERIIYRVGITIVDGILWANAIASHIPGYNTVSAIALDIILGPQDPA